MSLIIVSLIVIFVCLTLFFTIIAYNNSGLLVPEFSIDQLIVGILIGAGTEAFGLAVIYVVKYIFVLM